jgi:hypothetical protein
MEEPIIPKKVAFTINNPVYIDALTKAIIEMYKK